VYCDYSCEKFLAFQIKACNNLVDELLRSRRDDVDLERECSSFTVTRKRQNSLVGLFFVKLSVKARDQSLESVVEGHIAKVDNRDIPSRDVRRQGETSGPSFDFGASRKMRKRRRRIAMDGETDDAKVLKVPQVLGGGDGLVHAARLSFTTMLLKCFFFFLSLVDPTKHNSFLEHKRQPAFPPFSLFFFCLACAILPHRNESKRKHPGQRRIVSLPLFSPPSCSIQPSVGALWRPTFSLLTEKSRSQLDLRRQGALRF